MGFFPSAKRRERERWGKTRLPRNGIWTMVSTGWSSQCRRRPWTSAAATQFRSLRSTARPCNFSTGHRPPRRCRCPVACPYRTSASSRLSTLATSDPSSSTQLYAILLPTHPPPKTSVPKAAQRLQPNSERNPFSQTVFPSSYNLRIDERAREEREFFSSNRPHNSLLCVYPSFVF